MRRIVAGLVAAALLAAFAAEASGPPPRNRIRCIEAVGVPATALRSAPAAGRTGERTAATAAPTTQPRLWWRELRALWLVLEDWVLELRGGSRDSTITWSKLKSRYREGNDKQEG